MAYEIYLTVDRKENFLKVVREKMKERKMNTIKLAKAIDRPVSSVYCFFNDKRKINRFIAAEIADCLNITSDMY